MGKGRRQAVAKTEPNQTKQNNKNCPGIINLTAASHANLKKQPRNVNKLSSKYKTADPKISTADTMSCAPWPEPK